MRIHIYGLYGSIKATRSGDSAIQMAAGRPTPGASPADNRLPTTHASMQKPTKRDREQLISINRMESDVFDKTVKELPGERDVHRGKGRNLIDGTIHGTAKIRKIVSTMRAVAILMGELKEEIAERVLLKVMESLQVVTNDRAW